jgi:glutamate racemase
VAVISTEATLASQEYVHAIKEANPGVSVLGRAAPELVDVVEAGDADSARADAALGRALAEIFAWGADTLVLGCTHYPLLRPALRRVIGRRRMRVVDSAETTAARVRRILTVNRLEGGDVQGSVFDVLVTAEPGRFAETAARLFAEPLPGATLIKIAAPAVPLAASR